MSGTNSTQTPMRERAGAGAVLIQDEGKVSNSTFYKGVPTEGQYASWFLKERREVGDEKNHVALTVDYGPGYGAANHGILMEPKLGSTPQNGTCPKTNDWVGSDAAVPAVSVCGRRLIARTQMMQPQEPWMLGFDYVVSDVDHTRLPTQVDDLASLCVEQSPFHREMVRETRQQTQDADLTPLGVGLRSLLNKTNPCKI